MENRIVWSLVTLLAIAVLVAVGISLNGVRSNPLPPSSVNPIAPGNRPDADPLEPRLFGQNAPIRVHVAGAVKKPGVYSLPAWARVTDAVKKAGGEAANADTNAINLADPIRDGEQIRIPEKGKPENLSAHRPTPEPPPVSATVGGTGMGRYPFAGAAAGRKGKAAPTAPVNLNQAAATELEALPGVGPATAARIVAFRQEHGPFLRPDDLRNVKGIGEKKMERLRPLVTAP